MKKRACVLVYLALILVSSWSQDSSSSLVDTFITNFRKGSPAVKLQVLQDAADSGLAGMGPLYLEAVNYLLNNTNSFNTDLIYRKMSMLAINNIKQEQYTKARTSLWQLFKADDNTIVRVGILQALRDIAAGDASLIRELNLWLDEQNNIFKNGIVPDLQAIEACVKTLGALGDPTSFPILFRTYLSEYSDTVTPETKKALGMIKGEPKELYTGVIRNGFFSEKFRALEMVIADESFSDADKCEVAMFALSMGLYSSLNTVAEKEWARKTRYLAVDFLSEKNWSRATSLAIEHLNRTIAELDNGIARKSYLLDAIEALGNMQSHEAAKRLTLYLDHINSFTENGRAYDEQIVLQVVKSLGVLGDVVALENLLYTKYLNYSDRVKKAAADAVRDLQ